MRTAITFEQLEALRRLSTCAVSNAIDTFNLRLRNEGFVDSSVQCRFPRLAPMVGHAVTIRVSCSNPPIEGRAYADRTDWWQNVLTVPAPRVAVIQDADDRPGTGALLGEVHASILQALGCVGALTNGAVRDLPAVDSMGFQMFSGSLAVSHAYAHIIEIGTEVAIGGLKIKPGDLLHGDQHGVLSVPRRIAAKIPAAAHALMAEERKLIALCRSHDVTLEKLRAAVKGNR